MTWSAAEGNKIEDCSPSTAFISRPCVRYVSCYKNCGCRRNLIQSYFPTGSYVRTCSWTWRARKTATALPNLRSWWKAGSGDHFPSLIHKSSNVCLGSGILSFPHSRISSFRSTTPIVPDLADKKAVGSASFILAHLRLFQPQRRPSSWTS